MTNAKRSQTAATAMSRGSEREPMIASRRLTACLVCVAAAAASVAVAPLQTAGTSDRAREWPTYGHDPGASRFSPLTQITPANVGRLEVAWTYHMKPATPPATPQAGRGRGGSGFAASEVTPLVVDGVMYLSTPYYRGRGARCDDREGDLGVPVAVRQPVDARRRILARRREHTGADRVRHERREAVFAQREDRRPQRRFRREGRRRPRTRPRSCGDCPDATV